jgi:hypothetical protein
MSGPIGERISKIETKIEAIERENIRTIDTVRQMNEDHHKTLREMIVAFSGHITAETNRWLKAFYWIAFALMTVGGVTLGNTKLSEKIIEALFK